VTIPKAKRNTFQQLVKRKIPNFTLLFPDYKKYKIYGAVASMVSNDKLRGYAKKHGIFLITQKSRHLSLMNEQVTVFPKEGVSKRGAIPFNI
jgi:hypothetical protein